MDSEFIEKFPLGRTWSIKKSGSSLWFQKRNKDYILIMFKNAILTLWKIFDLFGLKFFILFKNWPSISKKQANIYILSSVIVHPKRSLVFCAEENFEVQSRIILNCFFPSRTGKLNIPFVMLWGVLCFVSVCFVFPQIPLSIQVSTQGIFHPLCFGTVLKCSTDCRFFPYSHRC